MSLSRGAHTKYKHSCISKPGIYIFLAMLSSVAATGHMPLLSPSDVLIEIKYTIDGVLLADWNYVYIYQVKLTMLRKLTSLCFKIWQLQHFIDICGLCCISFGEHLKSNECTSGPTTALKDSKENTSPTLSSNFSLVGKRQLPEKYSDVGLHGCFFATDQNWFRTE